MNWYKLFKLSMALRGEWWIDQTGSAQFADGDVGDINHEAHVIQAVQSEFADDAFTNMEYIDWEGFCNSLYEDWINQVSRDPSIAAKYVQLQGTMSTPAVRAEIEQNSDPSQIIHDLLLQRSMTEEEIQIANGQGDPRSYAMRKWGWKRVEGNNVETWTLSNKDLQNISRGLGDALESNGDYDEGTMEQELFNIFVFANNKWYNDVPLSVIDICEPVALRAYTDARMETFGR